MAWMVQRVVVVMNATKDNSMLLTSLSPCAFPWNEVTT